MKKLFYSLLILCIMSCKKDYDAPIPQLPWNEFDSSAAVPLKSITRQRMEGVYTILNGAGTFGSTAVVKWSYTAHGQDTIYHLSILMEKGVSYMICEGKRLDTAIVMKGYWRKMVNTETGSVRLSINAVNGATALLSSSPWPAGTVITINGQYSNGSLLPLNPFTIRYERPLRTTPKFEIVAHRGGGRTSDLLPASENSTQMIELASQFGATGIEIDVRLTKDGVPILFHDVTLNERVVEKNGMLGPVKDYTFDQLRSLVRLKRGGRIPTLREALQTVLYNTNLRYVWLDTKFEGDLTLLRQIQQQFLQLAAGMNRTLEITIGVPDKDVLAQFKKLNAYTAVPSVVELTTGDVQDINARIWAPQWTLGLQQSAVDAMHAQGRRVFTWTMDIPANIYSYMTEGGFDGILSNYPSIVAFYYYARP